MIPQPHVLEGTELLLVRHGRTEWNEQGRLQGAGDSPLTEEGIQAAHLLAHRLASAKSRPVACYSSPQPRALLTATLITAHLGIPTREAQGLRERSYGCLEGLTWAEQKVRHPEAHVMNAKRCDDYVPPGGGESRSACRARALDELSELARRHPGERVLCVTHSGLLSAIMTGVLESPPDARVLGHAPNLGISVLRWSGGRWQLTLWADAGEFQLSKSAPSSLLGGVLKSLGGAASPTRSLSVLAATLVLGICLGRALPRI